MILEHKTYETEVEGSFESSSFGIKNLVYIFRILRNSLYTEKIAAVVRETVCNMYDAHVITGNTHEPGYIKFPTSLDNTIIFRDYGPGLSPEDIREIYCQYGESTKRQSNSAIGSYGLGAKSPFCYTDSFIITSYWNGKKYQYNAYIGESQVGDIVLLSEEPTTERSGMEISIVVHNKDIFSYEQALIKYLRYFNVCPKISSTSLTDKINSVKVNTNKDYVGKFWELNPKDMSGQYVIMGQVPYYFKINAIDGASQDIINLCRYSLTINCNIGDIDVPPARESVEYTEKTKAYIKKRLEEVLDDIRDSFSHKFSSTSTLWDARQILSTSSRDIRELLNLTRNSFSWNNKVYSESWKIESRYTPKATKENPTPISKPIPFKTLTLSVPKNGDTLRIIHDKYSNSTITWKENALFIFNDLDNKKKLNNRIRTLLEAKGITSKVIEARNYYVYLMFPETDEPGTADIFKNVSEIEAMNGAPLYLASKLPETKIVRSAPGTAVKSSTPSVPKAKVYKFKATGTYAYWQRPNKDELWELASTVDVKAPHVRIQNYEFIEDADAYGSFNSTFSLCNAVHHTFNVPIYAVTPSRENPTEITLDDFITQKFNDLSEVEKHFLANNEDRILKQYMTILGRLPYKPKDKNMKLLLDSAQILIDLDLAKYDKVFSDLKHNFKTNLLKDYVKDRSILSKYIENNLKFLRDIKDTPSGRELMCYVNNIEMDDIKPLLKGMRLI